MNLRYLEKLVTKFIYQQLFADLFQTVAYSVLGNSSAGKVIFNNQLSINWAANRHAEPFLSVRHDGRNKLCILTYHHEIIWLNRVHRNTVKEGKRPIPLLNFFGIGQPELVHLLQLTRC